MLGSIKVVGVSHREAAGASLRHRFIGCGLAANGARAAGDTPHRCAYEPEHRRSGRSKAGGCVAARGLEDLGWLSGRIEIEFRWYGGDVEKARALTRELAELRPDLLVAAGTPSLFVLQQATRTPILFINVADPLVQGFVESLARPGGNITGFGLEEPTIGAKWVQLLTEIAPSFHQCHVQPGDSPLCAHVSAVNGSVASVHRVTNISRQQ